jgi:hypothetical protein
LHLNTRKHPIRQSKTPSQNRKPGNLLSFAVIQKITPSPFTPGVPEKTHLFPYAGEIARKPETNRLLPYQNLISNAHAKTPN